MSYIVFCTLHIAYYALLVIKPAFAISLDTVGIALCSLPSWSSAIAFRHDPSMDEPAVLAVEPCRLRQWRVGLMEQCTVQSSESSFGLISCI